MNKPSSGLRSIAGNAAYNVTAKAFNIALRLGYVVLLARLLGRADYGLLVYALTWYVLFIPLTNLGQDLVLARALGGRGRGGHRDTGAEAVRRSGRIHARGRDRLGHQPR